MIIEEEEPVDVQLGKKRKSNEDDPFAFNETESKAVPKAKRLRTEFSLLRHKGLFFFSLCLYIENFRIKF